MEYKNDYCIALKVIIIILAIPNYLSTTIFTVSSTEVYLNLATVIENLLSFKRYTMLTLTIWYYVQPYYRTYAGLMISLKYVE